MMIAPIVTPADRMKSDIMVEKTVWIPPGFWIEENSGKWLQGP